MKIIIEPEDGGLDHLPNPTNGPIELDVTQVETDFVPGQVPGNGPKAIKVGGIVKVPSQ